MHNVMFSAQYSLTNATQKTFVLENSGTDRTSCFFAQYTLNDTVENNGTGFGSGRIGNLVKLEQNFRRWKSDGMEFY